MRAILSVLVALSVAGPAASVSARAIRSGAGLPIGRRSDGSRRHGRRRRRGCPCAICARRNSPSPSTGSRGASSAPSSSPTAVRPSTAAAATPRDPYVSNNTDRRPGRLIMLVIDRNNIDTHTLRSAVAALKQFVTSIAPDDRLALVTIPPPGPSVDFTTNHAQVLDAHHAHRRVMDDPMLSRFNISDYEAHHVREPIEPHRHAAAAVSRVRRHRSQHDVALRSRRRAGSADASRRTSGS